MTENTLFSNEEAVIARAENIIETNPAGPPEWLAAYAELTREYRRLYSQIRRLVRLSDMMQRDMNRLNRKLEDMSNQDGLTGIPNRRRMDYLLEQEWRRAIRDRSAIGALMIDIDYFKPYNDTYGHGAGDECLKEVAVLLHSAVNRPADLVARYGGEEFLALLPQIDLPGLETVGEKMRRIISDQKIIHGTSATADHVTISLGGVVMNAPEAGSSWKEMLDMADQMLYKAKQAGRNRVVAALVD